MTSKLQKYNKHFIWLAIIAIIYLLLIFITPTESAVLTRYNLSPTKARILGLSVALPIIFIWATGIYAFVRLSDYARSIKDSKDGVAWAETALGLGWIAYSLPINSLVSSLMNFISAHVSGFVPTSVIISNYVSLAMLLIGMYKLSKGSTKLLNIVRGAHYSKKQIGLLIALIGLTIFFAIATFSNENRQFPSNPPAKAVYYLSDPLILLTILIPYMLVWFFGFKASYNVYQYRKFVPGSIYKKALTLLSSGILIITVVYILVRYLVSISGFLERSSLQAILGILYLLIIFLGLGYVLTALGSRRLKRIEEV